MTFKEIQDAVLSDRFDESQRGDAKHWVNHRYAWIWALEEWNFQYGTDDVTVTSGSQAVTGVTSDLAAVLTLQRSDGTPLVPLSPADFYGHYYGSTQTGSPEAFTVVNGAVMVGPTSNETATTYRLVYEKEPTLLVADNDVPAIPAGFHFALVHGGAAEGLKLQNDPTFQAFEQDFQASITAMRRKYLSNVRGTHEQFGRLLDW